MGCYPVVGDLYEKDGDIPLFCAYIAAVREQLTNPAVDEEGSPAHARVLQLVLAMRRLAAHVRPWTSVPTTRPFRVAVAALASCSGRHLQASAIGPASSCAADWLVLHIIPSICPGCVYVAVPQGSCLHHRLFPRHRASFASAAD